MIYLFCDDKKQVVVQTPAGTVLEIRIIQTLDRNRVILGFRPAPGTEIHRKAIPTTQEEEYDHA